MRATRIIRAGQEIFVSYGRNFWASGSRQKPIVLGQVAVGASIVQEAREEKVYRADDDEDADLVIQVCAMGRGPGANRGGGRGGASGRGGATGGAAAQEQTQRDSDIADQVARAQHDNRLTNVFRNTLPESTDSIEERLAGEIESAVGASTRIEMAAEIEAEEHRRHVTQQVFAAQEAPIDYGAVQRETQRFLGARVSAERTSATGNCNAC
jgi:hypothetical protein